MAFPGAETREQLILGVTLSLSSTVELPSAGRRQADDVSAPVGRIASARQVAVRFERIKQCDEDARVDVHHCAEVALGHRAAVMKEPE